MDSPVQDEGRTWIVTKMWGRNTEPFLERFAKLAPDQTGIGYEAVPLGRPISSRTSTAATSLASREAVALICSSAAALSCSAAARLACLAALSRLCPCPPGWRPDLAGGRT